MRTFIAVPLPEEVHALLSRLQQEMRSFRANVRWTATASIHLTLKFLGEIEPSLAPKLADALRAESCGQPGFQLSLHGLGGFPNLRSPRVLWCGLYGDQDYLGALQAQVEKACDKFGFQPEERGFHPHLTLGRVQGKTNLQRLLDYIKIAPEFEQTFRVDRYHVYKSVLMPKGANYTILETIELSKS
jgi:2'-5' RNA ligase